MNSHDYLSGLKAERSPEFIESYTAYGRKYRLARITATAFTLKKYKKAQR